MKFYNRILSTLLAVVLLLGSLTAFAGFSVSAASGTEAEAQIENTYIKQNAYRTPEEKLASMEKTFTRGYYELYVDKVSGEVATRDTRTGEILFTNPYDLASAKDAQSTKQEIMSQIIVQYEDVTTNSGVPLYSFKEAAMREQIKVLNIKNGIRVEYSIGQENTRKLVPRRISDENFQKYILGPLQNAVENEQIKATVIDRFKANYFFQSLANKKTPKLKENLLKKYPICAKMDIWTFDEAPSAYQINYTELYIRNYCDDYTFEQMDADHAETGYTEKEEKYPLFKMALEYSLSDTGVTVVLPCNGLRYDMTAYALNDVSILPYMGAGSSANGGYNFFPDGAGTLFDFEKLDISSPTRVSAKVYGADYAYHQLNTSSENSQKAIRYPVYGVVAEEVMYSFTYKTPETKDPTTGETIAPRNETITVSSTVAAYDEIEDYVKNVLRGTLLPGGINVDSYKRGYLAIIESGESMAKIETVHPGQASDYNYVRNYFNPKPKDSYDIADSLSVSTSSKWTVVCDRKYTGNITISYHMLTDEKLADKVEVDNYTYYETSWFGMAEAYRDHLVKTGTLSKLTSDQLTENIPLYMEVFGVVETQEQIATIPVAVMTPLTTFDDILTMYTELSEAGIKNINFKMTGFANGGLGMSTVPSNLDWEKNVGGADGFRALVKKAAAINSISEEHIGLYPDFDFAYVSNNTWFDSTNLKDDAVRTIDNRYTAKREYSSTQQAYVGFFELAISPSRYSKFYTKLLDNYSEYGLNSLSIGSLGSALNSDFDEDEPFNREDNKGYTEQAFKDIKNAGYSIMTESANAYTWGYVDHLLNMDLDSSRHIMASASVPFLGVVLHGYIQFTGTPFNEEGDTDYAMLRALENGASLYFILSYQNTSELKEFETLSQYYSVRYDIWKEDVIRYYSELNGLLKDVQDKVIIDHQFLSGQRILDVDEMEAELEAILKDAAELESAAQQQIVTDRVLAVANAWKTAEQSIASIQTILNTMNKLNSEIEISEENLSKQILQLPDAVNTALENMRPRMDTATGVMLEPLPAAQAAKSLIVALNTLRSTTTGILQKQENLQVLYAEGEALLVEVLNAVTVIQNSDLSQGVKDQMVAAIYDYYYQAKDLFELGDSATDSDPNYASAAAKRDKLVHLVTAGNASYVVDRAVAVLANVKSDDPVENASLLEACADALFTAEKLLEEGKFVQDDQDADKDDANNGASDNKFLADNNQIVLVTYGDRDDATHEKTAYKSFILNYNNYAVVVEYDGIIYTVPRGGYIVVYH